MEAFLSLRFFGVLLFLWEGEEGRGRWFVKGLGHWGIYGGAIAGLGRKCPWRSVAFNCGIKYVRKQVLGIGLE